MRILFINNRMAFLRSDGSFYVSKAAGSLVEKFLLDGNEIFFLQSYMNVEMTEESFADYKLPFSSQIHYVMVERKYPKIWLYFLLYLKGIVHSSKVDFLYIFYPDRLSYLGLLSKLFFKKKYGLYVRGCLGIYTFKSKILYRFSDICCTVSPQITDFINSRVKTKRAYTISPMIDLSISEDEVKKDYSKGISKILFVGRLTVDKGVKELLDAFVELCKVTPNLELYFVGDGPLHEELIRDAEYSQVKNRVHFCGHVSSIDDLREYYKKADILCLPSYHEGFPRVLYEAMLMKVAIVTTFVGTIPYLMSDSYNCFKIEPRNSKSILTVFERLLSAPNSLNPVVQNAYATVLSYLLENKYSHFDLLKKYGLIL